MTIKVYHADNPTFLGKVPESFPEGFTLVAEVATELLGFAFERTNHIDCPWFENDTVTVIERSRSTSVGDVMVVNGDARFLVAGTGFKQF